MTYLPSLFLSVIAFGQEKSGPPPPNRTIDPPVGDVVPIDENLIFLLLLGMVLGVYFYRKNFLKSRA